MKMIPIHDATAPITCTLDRQEIPSRLELIERLRQQLRAIERTEHGMLLHFPHDADVAGDVRRFAVDEKRCCAFWGFEVSTNEAEILLRWDAPPAADPLVAQLLAYFNGDLPITAI